MSDKKTASSHHLTGLLRILENFQTHMLEGWTKILELLIHPVYVIDLKRIKIRTSQFIVQTPNSQKPESYL